MQDGKIGKFHICTTQAARDAARRARLFEMLRQRELAVRALRRLHLKPQGPVPLPSPAALAASLADQSSVRPS